MEQVARGLHAVEHRVIVDVPQKEEPSLRSERRNDGVVFGGVVGVVSPGVFLRPRRRREEAAAQGSAHGLVVTVNGLEESHNEMSDTASVRRFEGLVQVLGFTARY